MGEKRRYMRFNVLLDAVANTGNAVRKLKVNNFSKEGVGVLSEASLYKGDDVELEMLIPGDNVPVMITGEVAWSGNDDKAAAEYKSGIKFKDINNSDRGRILDYIYKKWILPTDGDDDKKMEEK